MDIQNIEERNNFIRNLDGGLWVHWVMLLGSILEFYSSKKPKYDVNNDQIFSIELFSGSENSIQEFRDKFKIHIEQNGGKFKRLSEFPEYFHPRDKIISNLESDKIRIELYFEKDESKRKELLSRLNEFPIVENKEYRVLSKEEEAEHCLFWAVRYCRNHLEKPNALTGLSKATFLYGYACGLLGLDAIGMHYKLNEDRSNHEKGGDILKNKSDIAKKIVLQIWNDRFSNPQIIMKNNKAKFAEYICDNPQLIIDQQGYPLKKPNGDYWYTAPNTVSALLPKE